MMDIQRGSFDPYRSAHEASDLRPPEHYRHRKLMELALPTLAKPLSEVRPEVPTNPETGRTIRMFGLLIELNSDEYPCDRHRQAHGGKSSNIEM